MASLQPAPNDQPLAREQVYNVYSWSHEIQQKYEEVAERIITYMVSDAALSSIAQRFVLTRDVQLDRRQRRELEQDLQPHFVAMQLPVRYDDMRPIIDIVYDELIGLGPLGVPWRDDTVTEIMVDSWNKISVEREGRIMISSARFRSASHASSVARNLARMVSDRALSPTNPLVTAQLADARVNFAYAPVAASGLVITLRKFMPLMGMDGLLRVGSLTGEMVDFLRDAVLARGTILVSGGTGVGKTTLINALSEAIPNNERVITIEDALELKLATRFVVPLQTKERSSRDDEISITQEMLLHNSLRMRPDRIVVGEIRDAGAAAVMLQAANTGHEGTMTTIHANSADAALNGRLASLIRVGAGVSDDIAKYQIAEAFDLVVQGTRRRGRRFVEEIAEVASDAYIGTRIMPRTLFRGDLGEDGTVRFVRAGGIDPKGSLAEKMLEAGVNPARWIM